MMTRPMIRCALLSALIAALPAALPAQTYAYASAEPLRTDPARAEDLHAQAAQMAEGLQGLTGSRLRKLADLHVRAAELYAREDPAGIECLQHAANLLHRHDPARAAWLQEAAADRALAVGDVVRAAHGYVDVAAFVSRSLEEGTLSAEEWAPRVRELASRAGLLSSSPLISEADRDAIRSRIR